jgi:hypothetical protein
MNCRDRRYTLLLMLLAGTAGCGHALAWTSPQNVSSQASGSRAFGPRMASDPLGGLHLVWAGGADGAWQAWYQSGAGGTWSPPVALSGTGANRPDVAVDGNGTVHVVYEEAAERNIWYRRKPAGGSWATPVNLRTGGRSISPSIAVNLAGDRLIVAWHEDGQVAGEWDIFVNIFDGTAWSGAFNASANSPLSSNARTTIDPQGNMHVAWSDAELNYGTQYIRYRRRDAAGNWGSIQTVHTAAKRCGMGDLHASADGTVHLAYSDDDGTGWEILYRYSAGGGWSSGVNISNHPGTSDDIEPVLGSDALGRLFVAWHDYTNVFHSSAPGRTGPWSAREALVAGQYGVGAPAVAIDTGLNECAAWQARPVQASNWNIYLVSQSLGTPGPSGTLAGEVRDQNGSPVAGAVVSTGNSAGITNGLGQYSFSVPVGTWTAAAVKQYFSSQSIPGVVIAQNATTVRNFQITAESVLPVTGLVIRAGNRQNVLAWTHSASGQAVGTMIRYRTDGTYPAGPGDGTLAALVAGPPQAAATCTHAGLANGTTCWYAAFAYDNSPVRLYSSPAYAWGTPAGPCDYDRDGDVDQSDFGAFQLCLSGAYNDQDDPACAAMRLDADTDVDGTDLDLFGGCWSGPGGNADPSCLP